MKKNNSKRKNTGGTDNVPVPEYIRPVAGFPNICRKIQIVQQTSGILNRFKNIIF